MSDAGAYTFLLTDVEGSSRMWEEHPDAMVEALARHDELVGAVISGHGGTVVKQRGEGDSLFCVFERPSDAVRAAAAAQAAIAAEPWPDGAAPGVRIALHSGEPEARAGDYYGATVNRCARLRAAAHGGQILCSAAVYELVRDVVGELAFVDLGSHRLRDLARPERIYQVGAGPGAFPPLDTLDVSPHNLPLQPTPLIGREQELAELVDLLASERLVTITGPGGMGKTRLALQAAADLLPDVPHGAWFVALESVSDQALVPATVAAELSVPEDALLSALRGRELLLVLDNCEQVVEGTGFVGDVLAACPKVRVLATSRERLGLRWELEYRLEPMRIPDAAEEATPERLSAYDAVTLFVDRAAAARPGFAVTSGNASAVAEICARLDGLPLAIELAAARVRSFPPHALLERLGLDVLSGGPRDAAQRHRTIRAAIAWSVDLLTAEERTVLAQLSIFPGGARIDAAQAVCKAEVVEVLDSLVDKSLLREEEDPDGALRYRMLRTIRGFASELLEASGEADTVARRHAEHYASWARSARDPLRGPDATTWTAIVDRELESIRTSADLLADTDPAAAAGLVSSLSAYWTAKLMLRETAARIGTILDRCPDGAAERVPALLLRGAMCRRLGDLEAAERDAWQAHDRAEELSEPALIAAALGDLAEIMRLTGRLDQARDMLHARLEIARELHDEDLLHDTSRHLGALHAARADFDAALPLLESALDHYRRTGLRQEVATTLSVIGRVHGGLGDLVSARSALEEAIAIAGALGDDGRLQILQNNLVVVLSQTGDHEAARDLARRNLERCRESGALVSVVSVSLSLGLLDSRTGDVDAARRHLRESIDAARSVDDRRGAAIGLAYLAQIERAHGEHDEALRLAEESLGAAIALPERSAEIKAWLTLSEIRCATGDRPAARDDAERALEMARASQEHVLLRDALIAVGDAVWTGDRPFARKHFAEALELTRGTANVERVADLLRRAAGLDDDPRRSGRILGAVEAAGQPRSPMAEQLLAELRGEIGEELDAVLADGASLTLEEACDLVLGT